MIEDKKSRQLEQENERLKRENEELKKKLEETKKKYEDVQREFEEYKARHPETVGVKNGKPYILKSPTKSLNPKKPGAQPGHKPFFRKMPDTVDAIIKVPIEKCTRCCGRNLSEVQEIRERTAEDIPRCKPVVTRYLIERKYCRDCKCIVENEVPGVLPKARLGLRSMLLVTWLKIGLRLTEEAIPKVVYASFGLSISEREVVSILSQVANAFGPYYDQLLQDIRNAPARNMDETPWRVDGENAYLWAFITKGEALYVIASSRSHEVPLNVLGSRPNGVDIHDRFSAYETLARKTGNRPQQVCWAHILGDSKELEQFHGEEGALIHRTLKKTFEESMSYNHKGTVEDTERLFHKMKFRLERQYSSRICGKFVGNLLKYKDQLFVFVTNPHVDATNNAAERGLRHSVVARKISGGTRSKRGSEIYQTLISVVHTLRQRGQDLLSHGPNILLTSHG
ncbi:MAG: IS66 family transposase [Euryarchaeota archaeon]|nr:IS66 family transposase [Euryarchaeota archaeon]